MRRHAVVRNEPQKTVKGTRIIVAGDEGSLPLTTDQQILRRHFVDRLAHRSLTHVEACRQFAFASWGIFAALLLGRRVYGWRGRIALRWTLTGFMVLLLAYIGSRFVAEVLLGRL